MASQSGTTEGHSDEMLSSHHAPAEEMEEMEENVPIKVRKYRCTFMAHLLFKYIGNLVSTLCRSEDRAEEILGMNPEICGYVQCHTERKKQVRAILYSIINELEYWKTGLLIRLFDILRDIDAPIYSLLKVI